MLKNILILLVVLIASLSLSTTSRAVEMGISLVVNDNMISDLQVRDRMKMIMSSSGIPNTAENRAKLAPQILDMLVDETLKLQEAKVKNIEVSQEEIDEGLKQIASQNKFSKDQFISMLKGQGIPVRTLEDQIRSEVAWGKYVQQELRPQVNISDFDIDAELERVMNDPKFSQNLPSRDQVLNKLGNERLSRLQARELMDIKADAFIEQRG